MGRGERGPPEGMKGGMELWIRGVPAAMYLEDDKRAGARQDKLGLQDDEWV